MTPQNIRFPGVPLAYSQHLTGVRPDHRRQGIALALELRTVGHARQYGFHSIRSNGDNPAMLDINRKLGFPIGPWLIYNLSLG
ncbi:MAG: hypothetical protein H7145_14460 [Akkermansiaceae bacterium]|nr:hypothetical protein [Armatimonadota bacterium]